MELLNWYCQLIQMFVGFFEIEFLNIEMGCIMSDNTQVHSYELGANKKSLSFIPDQIRENVRKVSRQPSQQDLDLLNDALSHHFFFYKLAASQRNKFISKMEIYECDANDIIFDKGDTATLFFVILEGQVEITSQTNPDKPITKLVLERGNSFGDLALLFTADRAASAKSLTKCSFFCVSTSTFRKAVQEISRKNYEMAKVCIQKASIFAYLSKYQKNAIASNSMFLKFQPNQVIFSQGQEANSFYIIKSGRIRLEINGQQPIEMGEGQYFGQGALMSKKKRLCTAISLEETSLLSISEQSLVRCLGNDLKHIAFFSILRWALDQNEYFNKSYTHSQMERLVGLVEMNEYGDGEVICNKGDKVHGILIVIEEKVNSADIGSIFHAEEFFANHGLQDEFFSKDTLVKKGQGYVGVLKFQYLLDMERKNGKTWKQRTILNKEMVKEKGSKLQVEKLVVVQEFVREELFQVLQAIDISSSCRYLVKCIIKDNLKAKKMAQFFKRESELVAQLDYLFIPTFLKSYETSTCNYLVFENQHFSLLSDLLKQNRGLSKEQTQFYIGCLVLIVEYLHDNSIIYRDLKPDNILVDGTGFLHLFGFTTAKKLTEDSGFRTYTVVGTPHYMAPEIFSDGYLFSADLWSLGVIFYQMIFNRLPFGDNLEDPYEIIKQIRQKQLHLPTEICMDQPTSKLLRKLLQKNPGERFLQGVGKMRNDAFFEGLDWRALENKTADAPLQVKSEKKKTINKSIMQYMKARWEDSKENTII